MQLWRAPQLTTKGECAELIERIFFNGNVVTLNERQPRAQALAIQDGRIAAIGSNEEIVPMQEAETVLTDLQGRTVVPGLNDSHLHLVHLGEALERVNLAPARSRAEMVKLGQEFLGVNRHLSWLLGWGWNHDRFDDQQMPNRDDLDEISHELPILLHRTCGHIAVANTKALELAGIGTNPEQPRGGHIDLDPVGRPTGILRENATRLIAGLIPKETVADYKRILSKAASLAASYGLTSVQSDDLAEDAEARLQAYAELLQSGELPVRVNLQIRVADQAGIDNILALRERFVFPENTITYGPIKLMTDGSLGGRTAAMHQPYADDPGTAGVAILGQEEINRLLTYAHERGLQVAGHAIGDLAMDMLLNGFEHMQELSPKTDCRPRIIHAQITNESILDRCVHLGVACDIQPAFVGTDLHIVEQRVGRERAASTYAWKTMLRLSIPIAGGSDSPVESCNPLQGIYMAVTRQDLNGYPEDGWLPEQKLSILEALQLFTIGSAYVAFEEREKGSLTPGMLADLVILDQDLLSVSPEQLLQTRVVATYVGGLPVFHS